MAVKPGYMQTEVGVIPDEWVVKPLKEVGKFSKGKGLLKEDIKTSGRIPAIPYTALYTDFSELLNYDHIKWFVDDETQTYIASEPCVLIASSSNMAANTGKASALTRTTPVAIGREVIVFKTASDCSYISFLLSTSSYRQKTLSLARGTTIKHLYPATFQDYKIALPPLPEQRAIATALSDVDALLEVLEKLIAKKRDLKQAAMQQLLTGQTRLPGFQGEWGVKTLGDLGSTFGGLTGKTKTDFGEGSSQYITFMNVMTNVVIDCSAFERVKVSPTESQNRVVKGDLLFNGSSETPEEVALCSVLTEEIPNLFLNSFCFGFRFREGAEANGLFLAYYLRSKAGRELMKSLAQGSTRYNLSKIALLKSPFSLPCQSEQAAIATVLSDMDSELAALEQRLAKTRALKQGMMQELLTGRTRLV